MIPGISVDRKHADTDKFAPHATTIHKLDGGISIPSGAEVHATAAAISIGYFFSLILGIMIEPIQDKVAIPEPQIAPNTEHATVVTIARLPLIFPTNSSINPTNASPILPCSMILPAMMNNGIVSSTTDDSLPYIVGSIPVAV